MSTPHTPPPHLIHPHPNIPQVPLPAQERVAEIAAALPENPAWPLADVRTINEWRSVLGEEGFAVLHAKALEACAQPLKMLTREHFDAYHRDKTTQQWEAIAKPQEERMSLLVHAAAAFPDGPFADELIRQIEHTLKHFSWVSPYHDWLGWNYNGERCSIDIFTAMLAGRLALAVHVLGNRLPADLRFRLETALEQRVFSVLRSAYECGGDAPWWLDIPHNWNAVCLNGTTLAALTFLPSREERARFAAASELHVQRFLSGFGNDGACLEGIGYWEYGVSHFSSLAEALRRATGGVIDFWRGEKVRNIGAFASRFRLEPGLYPPFSDCAADARPASYLPAFFTCRLGVEFPAELAAGLTDPEVTFGTRGMMLFQLLTAGEWAARETSKSAQIAAHDWFPDAQIYIGRRGETSTALAVAVSGGHNDQPHNHNDLGGFVIAFGTHLIITDMGAGIYDKDTFSSRRYEKVVNNSYGHSVPVVDGHLQSPGAAFRSRVLHAEFGQTATAADAETIEAASASASADVLALDLTGAYDVPHLKSLVRTFTFSRAGAGSLTVEDRVTFTQPGRYETALITVSDALRVAPNQLRLGTGEHALDVTWNIGDAGDAEDPVEVTDTPLDAALRYEGPPHRRIGLTCAGATLERSFTMTFRPARVPFPPMNPERRDGVGLEIKDEV